MATKEALCDAFNDAKMEANATLEQIVVTPTMNSKRIHTARGLVEVANTAYLKMYKLYIKVTELKDPTISGDDLDSMKGDVDDVRGTLHDSRTELDDRSASLAANGQPDVPAQDSKSALNKMKFKVALENLTLDLTDVQEDINKVPNWTAAQDHLITTGMTSRKTWKSTLRDIGKKLNEQRNILNTFHYVEYREDYDRLANKFSNVQTIMSQAIEDIEHEDMIRELHCERTVKAAPTKIPVFSGLPTEDLLDFQDKFKRAVEDTKVTKRDQPDKLREHLAGKALAHIPTSIKDINYAWVLLKEAFGDPLTLLNYRMQSIRNMKPISDKQMDEKPIEAVDWFLEMERCIMEITKLGDRGGQLSFTAFSHGTISEIIRLLPNHMENKVIGHDSEGRDKLMFTVQLMTERRRICNRRGTSYANRAIGGSSTTASAGHHPSATAPAGHLSSGNPQHSLTLPPPI